MKARNECRLLGRICAVLATTMLLAAGLSAEAAEVKPMISAGYDTNLALKSDGTVLAWGTNKYGQVGDGSTTSRNKPIKVDLADVTAVSAGYFHALALKSDGTVWAWGSNSANQLGVGSNTPSQSTTPIQTAVLTDIAVVAAGGWHSLALKKDGTVLGWGAITFSVAESVATGFSPTPKTVYGLSNIVAIAAGGEHAVALKSDGTVWAWGKNDKGQIGDGTTTDRPTPAKIAGLPKIASIAAGRAHTLAVSEDGKVYAWGLNELNQLGDETTQNRSAPVAVKMIDGDMSNIATVSAGVLGNIAISKSGNVYQWGTLPAASPSTTLSVGLDFFDLWIGTNRTYTLPSRATQVSAGSLYTLILNSDGSVYSFGINDGGQLGTGNTTGADVPIQVSGEGSEAKLNLGSLRTAMSTSVTAAGTTQTQSLTVKLNIDSEDAGKSGKYYVAAKLGDGYYFNDGASWAPYTGGAFPVFASGALADKSLAIYTDLDTTGLAGTAIIVGYGSSESDMVNNLKYRTVHTVE